MSLQIYHLDDDPIISQMWKMHFEKKGIPIRLFNKVESLREVVPTLSKDVSFYIDSNLDEDIRGEDLCEELGRQGFTEIYLSTGYDKEDIELNPYIKDVIGKDPSQVA